MFSEVDLLLGGYVNAFESTNYFSHSIMFGQDDVTWCVPRAKLSAVHFNIVKVVDQTTMEAAMILFTTFCITFYIFWKFDREPGYQSRDMADIALLVVLPMFLGFSVSEKFKATHYKTRILYTLATFYGFLLTTIFCCFILSLITITYREKQVSKVDELTQRGFRMKCTGTTFAMILHQTKVILMIKPSLRPNTDLRSSSIQRRWPIRLSFAMTSTPVSASSGLARALRSQYLEST